MAILYASRRVERRGPLIIDLMPPLNNARSARPIINQSHGQHHHHHHRVSTHVSSRIGATLIPPCCVHEENPSAPVPYFFFLSLPNTDPLKAITQNAWLIILYIKTVKNSASFILGYISSSSFFPRAFVY